MTEWEIIMFKGDAVVDGSRHITSDWGLIEKLKDYARLRGYEFSATEISK